MASSLPRNPPAATSFAGVILLLLASLLFCRAPTTSAFPSPAKTVCAAGTTDLDGARCILDVLEPAAEHTTSSLSVLMFQTSRSWKVPCQTPQVIDPPPSYEPPFRTIVATPTENGTYPVILFKHGFNLANCHYNQLFQYLAAAGYIMVAPQAVTMSPDATGEIGETARIANWISNSLAVVLNAAIGSQGVFPDVGKLVMAGHSRGGKVAFALALGEGVETDLPSFSALVALDPVDGNGGDEFVPQLVEAACYHTRNKLSIPVLILGTGYGNRRGGPFGIMPPCAPECCNHAAYFNCSSSPLMYHLSALEYGHLDFLDDSVWLPSLMCVSGTSKAPLRNFSGRLMVAFLQAVLEGNDEDMDYILENWEEVDSVKLDEPQIFSSDDNDNDDALKKSYGQHIKSPKDVVSIL